MNNPNASIKNPNCTCCRCLNESSVEHIEIHSMGWGSGFDGWSTQINLCDECYKETNPEWWQLRIVEGKTKFHGSAYEYEDEIFDYVAKMPLAGQELFWNRYSYGWNSNGEWEPQDYIDYSLGILPHEKCKEYCVYSHQEIEAYKTRFPTCQHPVHVNYGDSIGCRCPFGAFGDEGQKAGLNIWDACYRCKHYQVRETPIKEIKDEDFNDYKTYYAAKLNQDTYKSKFE